MTEDAFQQTVIELAQYLGYKVAHFRGVRIQRRDGSVYYQTPVQADGKGFPDLVLTRPGRLIFAELKSDTGKVSPEQQAWLEAVDAGGAEAYTWKPQDWQEVQMVLTSKLPPNKYEEV
jgi:hypothetical protein